MLAAVCATLPCSACFLPVNEGSPAVVFTTGPEVDGGPPAIATTAAPPDFHATVRPDCAPWDGPAHRFTFSQVQLDCDTAAQAAVTAAIYESPLVPGTYTLGNVGGGRWQGDASSCGALECFMARPGSTLTIDSVEAGVVTGTIELRFESGDWRGRFRAAGCPSTIPSGCG